MNRSTLDALRRNPKESPRSFGGGEKLQSKGLVGKTSQFEHQNRSKFAAVRLPSQWGVCCILWQWGSQGGLLRVREHLFAYLRAALQLHWHQRVGSDWALSLLRVLRPQWRVPGRAHLESIFQEKCSGHTSPEEGARRPGRKWRPLLKRGQEQNWPSPRILQCQTAQHFNT